MRRVFTLSLTSLAGAQQQMLQKQELVVHQNRLYAKVHCTWTMAAAVAYALLHESENTHQNCIHTMQTKKHTSFGFLKTATGNPPSNESVCSSLGSYAGVPGMTAVSPTGLLPAPPDQLTEPGHALGCPGQSSSGQGGVGPEMQGRKR